MRLPVTIHTNKAVSDPYLASYKEWLGTQAVTANTARAYQSRVKQFLLFREYANLNDHALDDLNSANEVMNLYLQFLKQSKGETRSLNANVNALNNFSHFLGLKGTQLKRERSYVKPMKILTIDEQKEFLRSVEQQVSIRDKALALILFYTGLRIGDCARLNVEDIVLNNNETSDNQHGFAYISLDNKAKVPLNKSTIFVLRQWLKERERLTEKIASNQAANEQSVSHLQPALWLTTEGQRLSISGITFILKRIGWQAQLMISTEILRRTWLTNTADQLNKTDLASKFGGHISPATIKRYGALLPMNAAISPLEH